jgi:hypothetical protein
VKRNAKQRGSGGRLRWTLLAASAMAFLLVPTAVANAAEAEVVFAGSGAGTVIGGEPVPGEPPIDCAGKAGVAEGPVCVTETQPFEGFDAVKVEREAAPGSEFAGFKVIAGQNFGTCPVGSAEATECVVMSFGEKIIIEATFNQKPNVHITIDGDGSGSVIGVPAFVGKPPVDCDWNGETETLTGDCDVLASTAGGFTGINVKHEAAPGSEFAGWTLIKGFEPEEGCEPFGEACGALILGPHTEIQIHAKFDKFVPKYKLNLSTTGTGSGSLQCNTGSGAEACKAEYPEGTEVTVIPSAGTGSEFVEFNAENGGECSGASCVVEMTAERNVNAQFDLEQVPFAVNQTGEGAVLCNGEPCAATYSYGTEIEVTASAAEGQQLASIVGGGSAAGSCEKESTTAGSCDFTITAASSVTVEFKPAATVDVAEGEVFGTVPQTTTLESACSTVDLGEFIPNAGEDITYTGTCLVEVTATGEVNDLTADDKTGNDTGFLTQKPGSPFTLESPLNVKGTALGGLGGVSGANEALTSPVNLVHYPTPVSGDDVEVEFSQLIGEHEPLHTGVYAKTITLTLEQTTP